MSIAGRVWALALAVVSGVACAALYAFATGTRAGRGLDEEILNNALEGSLLGLSAHVVVHIVNPVTAPAAVVGILWLAAVRRGRVTAVVLGITLVAANASAALLKVLLRDSDPVAGETARDLGVGFYPSGHVTAAMSFVLAMLLLVGLGPARARVALAGGLAVGAMGVANVVAQTHHASDVVGGFLLATAWMALMKAVLPTAGGSQRRGLPREALALAVLVTIVGALGAAVAASHGWPAAPVAAAAGVCSIALALVGAMAALEPARPQRIQRGS
jgi:membrane-associated phospholipid phosphatase